MKMIGENYFLVILLMAMLLSCQNDDDASYTILKPIEGEQFSGGDFTVFNTTSNAFGIAGPTLSIPDQQRFGVGNSLFNQNWVTAPASTTARDGLGPFFNARACSNCHFKDGRGRPPRFDGELNHGLLLQLSNGINSPISGKEPHAIYGNQLQDQAILGLTPEGAFRVAYTIISGTYPDGMSYELRKPNYILHGWAYGDPKEITTSPRVGSQVIGMGLLDAIPESDILANEDPNDKNHDGISGKANYVWDVLEEQSKLGRYGWKANQPSLEQQNASAFSGDLGITTPMFPDTNCSIGVDCSSYPDGGEPEISQKNFDNVTFYTATLSVPARRAWDEQNVLHGKKIFNEIQCASCHISQFTTGQSKFAPELSNQIIYPYTDLLLHDMGQDLADNASQFLANGSEWRTPTPLGTRFN